mmetsp:Transcript_18407/g.51340  ORF Transcript_18407/g.51340 Transcript_18407/m.51340 type:complete len:269 (+) Transcript_18407:809-1615(+)
MDPLPVRRNRRPDVRHPCQHARRNTGHDQRQGGLFVDSGGIHHARHFLLCQGPAVVAPQQAREQVAKIQREGNPRFHPGRYRVRRHWQGGGQARQGLRHDRDCPAEERPVGRTNRRRSLLRRRVRGRERQPESTLCRIGLRPVQRAADARDAQNDREGPVRCGQEGVRLYQRWPGTDRGRGGPRCGPQGGAVAGGRPGRVHQGAPGRIQRVVEAGQCSAESTQHGPDGYVHAGEHSILRQRKPAEISARSNTAQSGGQKGRVLKNTCN